MIKKPQPHLLSLALSTILLSSSALVYGAGFQLFEGNAVNMGDFTAGAVTNLFDASTGTYNPAGLPSVGYSNLVTSGVGVFLDNRFDGTSQWRPTNPLLPFVFNETGSSQGGGASLVPAFHILVPYNKDLAFSLNITSPFGLETDYNDAAITRYSATDSRLITINVSPAFGYRINPHFALGAGLDFQYAKVDFDSIAGIPALLPPGEERSFDSVVHNDGNSWDWTWHAGLMMYFNGEKTRVGANYQSDIQHKLTGQSTLNGPLAFNSSMQFISDTLNAKVTLPATTSVGIYQEVNDAWSVMASVNYTDWSVFKNIQLNDVAGVGPSGSENAKINVTVPQNFDDTVRLAFGAEWRYSTDLTLRFGTGFERTPTNNQDRSIRLPDADRVAIAIGAHYQATDITGIDVGYTHFFVQDARIDNTGVTGGQTVVIRGDVENHADLLGIQLSLNLDKAFAKYGNHSA